MHRPLIPQCVVSVLLAAGVLLPIVICVILGVAGLLGAMADIIGGAVLQRVALGCGILWAIDLVCLVLVLAIHAVKDHDESEDR